MPLVSQIKHRLAKLVLCGSISVIWWPGPIARRTSIEERQEVMVWETLHAFCDYVAAQAKLEGDFGKLQLCLQGAV